MRTPPIIGDSLVGYGGQPSRGGDALAGRSPAKVFVFALLGVVSMVFLLLSIAYLERSRVSDWQWMAGFAGAPLADTARLWFNTALLAASSAALQWARIESRRDHAPTVRAGVALGALLAVGFVLGQLGVWQDLVARGHLAEANPANGFFYLITGLHGVHLLGGLVALAFVAARLWRSGVQRARTALALCSLYWHFLFALWLVMFALLAAPRDALEGFAAICGFR
jgi:cytochrome c oxidase subunit 3